ncbi:MAG: cupin domain-containing protein [Rhodothermales bacterium]|nr:cupin domain-containing protein [Rhodothermales bacterium]
MDPAIKPYTSAETLEIAEGIAVKILLTGDDTGGAIAVFEDIVAPDTGPPRHIHHLQDETFFFLEGHFDVEIEGALHHFGPGDTAFVPKGSVHAFKNVGSAPGCLRYTFNPALRIEEMFRALHFAFMGDGFDEGAAAALAAEHGQEMAGPPL